MNKDDQLDLLAERSAAAHAAVEAKRDELAKAQGEVEAAEVAYEQSETDARWRRVSTARDKRDRAALDLKNRESALATARKALHEALRSDKAARLEKLVVELQIDTCIREALDDMRALATLDREAAKPVERMRELAKAKRAAFDEAAQLASDLGSALPVTVQPLRLDDLRFATAIFVGRARASESRERTRVDAFLAPESEPDSTTPAPDRLRFETFAPVVNRLANEGK